MFILLTWKNGITAARSINKIETNKQIINVKYRGGQFFLFLNKRKMEYS